MLKNKNPISFHIVEKESKQCLMTWTYPTITDEAKRFIISHCFCVNAVAGNIFFYVRKSNIWIYFREFVSKNGEPRALIVTSEDVDPTKYKILTDIFVKKYVKSNNPIDLVKAFLNLIVSGSVCYQENGSEISLNLKSQRVEPKIKELIRNFGLETILLYNAILLKRRILVYHHDIDQLQQKLLAIASLVPIIRNYNEFVYPLIDNIHELKGISFYLAGSTNAKCTDEKYYELYVNLVSNEITISKEAKKHFTMTKIHKDLAHLLVELSQSDIQEAKVLDDIYAKTSDILKQLNSIATCEIGNKKMVSLQDLKSKKFNPTLENFLFNLAVAENMMLL